MFDDKELRPTTQALATNANLVVLGRPVTKGNVEEALVIGGTNILGCAVSKALRLTAAARRRFYSEDSCVLVDDKPVKIMHQQ